MYQVWKYIDYTGIERYGIIARTIDRGGTDVSYHFWRLGDDGHIITFPNGGHTLDIISGGKLKQASWVGAVKPGEPYTFK